MKAILIIFSLFIFGISYAQGNSPACSGDYSGPCFAVREYPDGDKYVGEFINGKKDGQGTYTFADGRKYVGQWKDGKNDGQGTFTHASGDKYVGQFKDSQYSGMGTYTFADGDKYIGEFINGKQNGQGVLYNTNGAILQKGLWRDGVFVQAQTPPQSNLSPCNEYYYSGTCFQVREYDNGQYVGQLKDGLRNGQGAYTFASGNKYVGQFKDNKFTGQGTYTFADGRKYVGQWKDDKYDGWGTLYYANGAIYKAALWRDDNLVYSISPPVVSEEPVIPKPPEVPKPPVNNAQDIKRQKCIRLGLAPGSADFQQCMN